MGIAATDTLGVNYPTRSIRLPVGNYTQSSSDTSLAVDGGIVALADDGMVTSILWQLKSEAIEFTPLVFGDNNFGVNHQSLRVELANAVLRGCLSIAATNDALIVEFLDSEYLFITLKLELSSFVGDSTFTYGLDRFDMWGHVSVPYSFELVSEPFRLARVDELNLVLSLKDGQLLHLQRPALFEDCNVYNFAPSVKGSRSLNPFIRWKGTKSATTMDGVSSNAVVDFAVVASTLVTLSVAKTLQFWSLANHSELCESVELSEDVTWLTSSPGRHLRILDNKVVVCFTSATDTVKFVTYDVQTGAEDPDSSIQPETDGQWFVQDFLVTTEELTILWKNSTASRLQRITSKSDESSSLVRSFPQVVDDASAKARVLNAGVYSTQVVATSLSVIASHHQLDVSSNSSLRKCAREVVSLLPNNSWINLDSVCGEYAKMTHEVLALANNNGNIYAGHVDSGLRVFRDAHRFESEILGELGPIFDDLAAEVSTPIVQKVVHRFTKLGSVTADSVLQLYEVLAPRFDDSSAILNKIQSVPNVVDILNQAVSIPDPVYSSDRDTRKSSSISQIIKQTALLAIKQIATVHSRILGLVVVAFTIIDTTPDVLEFLNKILALLKQYQLLVAIIDTCYASDSPNARIERRQVNQLAHSVVWSAVVDHHPHLNWLIRNRLYSGAFDYVMQSVVTSSTWMADVVVDLINRGEGKYIRDRLFDKLNPETDADRLLMGIVYLTTNEPEQFYQKLCPPVKLGPTESARLEQRLLVAAQLKPAVDALIFSAANNNASDYYSALSQLAQIEGSTREYDKVALECQQQAISLATSPASADLFQGLFNLGLRLDDYDAVYNALSNLDPSYPQYQELFARLIKHLVNHRSIDVLFAPHQNELYRRQFHLIDTTLMELANSELALSSCLSIYQYLYSWRLFGASRADNFVNGRLQDQLADKRGAVESLYMFITRFKNESANLLECPGEAVPRFKLTIIELYLIILNCLKGFSDKDDQWLRKREESGYRIVRLDDISMEYFQWLMEVEGTI